MGKEIFYGMVNRNVNIIEKSLREYGDYESVYFGEILISLNNSKWWLKENQVICRIEGVRFFVCGMIGRFGYDSIFTPNRVYTNTSIQQSWF